MSFTQTQENGYSSWEVLKSRYQRFVICLFEVLLKILISSLEFLVEYTC